MRPLPFLFTALLATTLAAQEVLTAQGNHAFKVGTWNLEFLGATGNFRNDLPPRTEADHQAIGKKVAELGVCVLAVQEINDEASLRKVAAGAGPQWDVLLGTSGSWDDGKTAQRIGFLWDRSQVNLLFAEELLQLPREYEGQPIFHRVPVTAAFQHKASGCDFRLVTVHLKAGQKPADEHKRRGEATALAGWLDSLGNVPNEDPDVLLLGDFNSTYGKEPETLLEQTQRRRYLEHRAPTPTIMHFADPIDQVVVGHQFREVRLDSLTVDADFDGQPKDTWRRTYSDHFPVTATLVARSDDDPQAVFSRGGPEQALPRAQPKAPKPPVTLQPEPWPPQVGQLVRVTLTDKRQLDGPLLQPLPTGAGGWVVVEVRGQIVGAPLAQVLSVTLGQ